MAKGYAMRIDERTASQRIKEKTGGLLEYVSGYTIKERPVKVRCTVCGWEFERTYHNITTKGSVTCPCCIERERARNRELKSRDRQKQKAEKFTRTQLISMKVCKECGSLFVPRSSHQVRCSRECTVRNMNRGADDRLNRNNVVDKDITLTKLFLRDNGKCWLCGGSCDWEDSCTRTNGVVVVGASYPSIDHVIPLARGGKHSWSNIRLAHKHCNELKNDKLIAQ